MTEARESAFFLPFAFDIDSIEIIDREISKCYALLSNLKSRRNRHVPISKLPPEVLCTVFVFASLGVKHNEWIQLSHVCRDWRYMSLQYPSLWANPPLQCSRWTEVMLARSKMAGLTLQASNADFREGDVLRSLFNILQFHHTRIQHLASDLSPEGTALLLKNLPTSTPRLESLVIERPDVSLRLFSDSNPEKDSEYKISDDSLRDIGRLRQLELTGIQINWDLHLPNTLTNLKLHDIPSYSIQQMDKIQDALERMPLLQSLDLTDVLPDIAIPSMSFRVIHLPKLQALKLSGGVAELECLLQGLTFPPNTFVELTCKQKSLSHYFNMSGIFSSLSRSQKDEAMQIKTLDVTLSNTNTFSLFDSSFKATCQWEIRAFTSIKRRGPPLMDLKVVWFQSASIKSGKVLRELVQNVSLDHVRNLSLLGSVDSLSVRTILDTVGALPRVRTLTADLGPKLVRALKSNLRGLDPSNQTNKISFPSLRNLILKGDLIEEFACETGDVTVEMLLACLAHRSRCGAAVKSLNIEECKGVDRFEAERLEKVVKEVEWESDIQSDEEQVKVWRPDGWRNCDEVEGEEQELFLRDYDEYHEAEEGPWNWG